jgi:hypothetical protein
MERHTRKDAEAQFKRLVAAIGGRIAVDYKDVGAYRLDWNPIYGGGNIERIYNDKGAVTQPWGARRMNAREFSDFVYFSMNTLAERDRLSQGQMVNPNRERGAESVEV